MQDSMIDEQRKSRRHNVGYSAWVALESGPHACVLSDVSESGARIAIDDPAIVPDSFILLLASNGSARRRCEVVWREDHQLGVRFDLPTAKKPAPMRRRATDKAAEPDTAPEK